MMRVISLMLRWARIGREIVALREDLLLQAQRLLPLRDEVPVIDERALLEHVHRGVRPQHRADADRAFELDACRGRSRRDAQREVAAEEKPAIVRRGWGSAR